MKCIPESRRVHLNMISTSVLLSLDWYICWWTISPGGYHTIIRPVVNASKLTWFILIVFLNDGMVDLLLKLIKTKVLLTQARVTLLSNLAFSGFLPTTPYLAFQSFDLDRTWWRLFPKSVVHTKLDFYVFIRKHELSSTHELYFQLLLICRVESNQRSSWIWRSSSFNYCIPGKNLIIYYYQIITGIWLT